MPEFAEISGSDNDLFPLAERENSLLILLGLFLLNNFSGFKRKTDTLKQYLMCCFLL